ncbi:hypothetical protein Xen7305DRAFT_00012250 [Xenococcus sp. PCC 7305]|uniref:hypothetical protein n=1 Tax=Xenococcus sp. PCC 7305 TaxID=102125 RepID=UPI0002AC85F6|nr:hypothetical protein [Xenococcus sp. PCC 7305]ELS01521.1 hypothetical protein Xen7305DRAFT_00012250 [Xenococcus sp. PCC 7305]
MKRILISTLSTILLSTIAVPALSQVSLSSSSKTSNTVNITPFNLVTGAYQGRFEDQDIPSNAVFLAKVRSNRIGAEELVQGAIAAGRLSEDTLYDQGYLNSVETLIDNLDKD